MKKTKITLNELKNIVKDIMKENDEYLGDTSILADFLGRDITIKRNEDGLLEFSFDTNGWYFDTHDVAEGVSIITSSSRYLNEKGIREIKITEKDKKNVDIFDCLYWLTGGNSFWRHDPRLNVKYEDISGEIIEKFGNKIKTILNESNNLGDMIDGFKEFKEDIDDDYMEFMRDNDYMEFDNDDLN